MTLVFVILIILASVVLGLIVLIQNPKGGGLTGNIAGLSNQFMGVKQTTDVLEKGTWVFAGIIGLLCLLSVAFTSAKSTVSTVPDQGTSFPMPSQPQPQQQQPQTLPVTPGTGTPGQQPATNPAPVPAPANNTKPTN
jgi:preprotein translocase subunit SecG